MSPYLELILELESESAAIHRLNEFALTVIVLLIAVVVRFLSILCIIPAHLLQMQIAAVNLVGTLKYLFEEAFPHVFAHKDHVVHEVLEHCKLVLLTVG